MVNWARLIGAICAFPALTRAITNPVLWNDLADIDIRRVNDAFYYSASTMHYSPGAPILRSYDLTNWEYIGHSVPKLEFGTKYDLTGGRAYIKGIWASWLVFHPQQNKWFWGGCVEFGTTYIYSASSVTGTWSKYATLNKCYYDAGIMIDTDGTPYLAYTNQDNIWVAQMSSDLKSEVRSQQVYVPGSEGYLEGSRPYKINGQYYILVTHPASHEYTLKSSSPFGSYTIKVLANNVDPPTSSGGGKPHQGGIVDTTDGKWYYVGFVDAYPGGRIPVVAPITWGSDGFPTLTLVSGRWGVTYPDFTTQRPTPALTGIDSFQGTSLGHRWEWNHNPDTTKFSVQNGLTLYTATVTTDLYAARNTLSQRILGPKSTATIRLNYGNMKDGDRAGLVLLRDSSAWIGVKRDGGVYTVGYTNGLTMNSDWTTSNTGTTVATAQISGGTIWLRITADIAPNGSKLAQFSYSTDGNSGSASGGTYKQLGQFTMGTAWQFFMGYRFAIFNYATSSLGGYVQVPWFDLGAGTSPSGEGAPTTSGIASSSTRLTTTGSNTTPTTTSTTTSTSPTGCTVPKWGQCGGQDYTGCKVCAAGSTCTVSDQWYSQCL